MPAMATHNLDNEADKTDTPHVRLCHLLLRHALRNDVDLVEIEESSTSDNMSEARARIRGEWQPFMSFPHPVFRLLLDHFTSMADFGRPTRDGTGTLRVYLGERTASIGLSVIKSPEGIAHVTLTLDGVAHHAAGQR